jgi:hypothetical protein
MKTCGGCGAAKSVSEFYLTAKGAPAAVCKACHRRRMKVNRLTNPAVQERDRARAKTPERKAHMRRVADQWRKEHPESYRAQTAVNNAIRDKRLQKGPCTICGAGDHVHAHHKDYAKPLDVIWLCAKCHHRIHAVFPELGGHHQEAG